MKNDIDALLEAMFRNGKLNLKGTSEKKPAPPEQSKPVSLEWDPLENSRQARQALDAVEQGSAGISEALQKNLEQLARDAEAEMKGLEQRLRQDGVADASAGNAGSEKDLEAAFAAARREAGERRFQVLPLGEDRQC